MLLKKIYFPLFILLVGFLSLSYSESVLVKWESETTHDFGDIPHGKDVSHTFYFKNISKDSLLIDNVRTSCGCTAANWEETATPPDSIGTIRIEFDGEANAFFKKWIRVYFNGQRKAERLFIEGFVYQE